MYEHPCKQCGGVAVYQTRKGFFTARKNKTACHKCRGITPKRLKIDLPPTQWSRECSGCKTTLYYRDKGNMNRAIKNNSVCSKCKPKLTKEQVAKISKSLRGKKFPNRASNTKVGKVEQYFRPCPVCNKQLGYVGGYAFERAIKSKAICNSCSNTVYKKSWNYVIKDSHRKKMAATKAGYDTFTAYMADLDNKKKYQRKVRALTRKQPIEQLENYNKLRGLCGVQNAYQLDHIVSIEEGYRNKLAAEKIADISNLQIIPWKENRTKAIR